MKKIKLVALVVMFVSLVSCANLVSSDASATETSESVDITISVENIPNEHYMEISSIEAASVNSDAIILTRLANHDIYVSSRQLPKINYIFFDDPDTLASSPITFLHYGNFDLLYVHSATGYRGQESGICFVFENSIYKGCIDNVGNIDPLDCFKTFNNQTWLTVNKSTGGSGVHESFVEWFELTSYDLALNARYTKSFKHGNFGAICDYTEDFIEIIEENGHPVIVTDLHETLSDRNKVIELSKSDSNKHSLGLYTSYDTFWDNYDKDYVTEHYANELNSFIDNGTPEEQQAAREILNINSEIFNINENPATAKPVIYFYPTKTTDIAVNLDFDGALTYTFPTLRNNAWNITANPDGSLIDNFDNSTHYYLFWEGNAFKPWNHATGFVVNGKDTEKFLIEKLSSLGLTPKEYNDFIVYWVPKMKENPYNLIHFSALEEYSSVAKLDIVPQPDTILRVHMVWKALGQPIKIKEQTLSPTVRNGFTVVEWGGTEVFN